MTSVLQDVGMICPRCFQDTILSCLPGDMEGRESAMTVLLSTGE